MSEIAASAPNRPDREQKTSCRLLAQESKRLKPRQAKAGSRFGGWKISEPRGSWPVGGQAFGIGVVIFFEM
jgi:hypothetical protein